LRESATVVQILKASLVVILHVVTGPVIGLVHYEIVITETPGAFSLLNLRIYIHIYNTPTLQLLTYTVHSTYLTLSPTHLTLERVDTFYHYLHVKYRPPALADLRS
jgi:hypothetical protein